MKNDKWDARIRRAAELASKHGFAAEGLRFYGRVAQFQQSLYSDMVAECGSVKEARPSGALRQELDLFLLLPRFAPFLSIVESHAPTPLAQSAGELRSRDSKHWQEVLTEFWRTDSDTPASLKPAESHLSWVFLQPYAEYLADHTQCTPPDVPPSVCPLCSGKPQVGVLRAEGDGGKRSLLCALCATEWDFRRLVCPACGEEDGKKLAVYTAAEFTPVRVEACDTCRRYIKTVDLTKDGHAVPVVDELATIPLNLWAADHGYLKLHTNLLGI
ncbi:MAG: formate dehydrogenase accessory protein FdhE [Candidatus Acidiferrales bacterium]